MTVIRRMPLFWRSPMCKHVSLLAWVAPLLLCLFSIAEARRLRYHADSVSHASVADQVRERQGEVVRFAAAIDAMIGECRQEAEFLKAPLDFPVQEIQLTDEQRAALAKVQTAVQA